MKNILFIFSDQQRQDTMGCYGQTLNVTPNLDKLAEEGTLFENSFTAQPVCGPARACLQTGKYPTQIGAFKNGISLPIKEKTMAKYLNDIGYETAYVGKWHLASDDGIEEYHTSAVPASKRGGYKDYWMASDILEFTSHGYDGFVFNKDMEKIDFKGYRVDAMTDYAISYLNNRNTTDPFFLFISYIEPHHQNDMKQYEGPNGSKEKFKNFNLPKDIEALGGGDAQKEYADYLGCCNSLDHNVGRLIETLKANGEFENTIIIYTSDHGCHFKTRNRDLIKPGADDYKRSCHDGVIKTPLIIYGDNFKYGRVNNFVSLVDLPPTILKIAGINPSPEMQGTPIQDKLINQDKNIVFIQISESIVGRAIRTDKFKYCVFDPSKNPWKDSYSDNYTPLYLYDLEKDPLETTNLINDSEYTNILKILNKEITKQIFKYENKVCNII